MVVAIRDLGTNNWDHCCCWRSHQISFNKNFVLVLCVHSRAGMDCSIGAGLQRDAIHSNRTWIHEKVSETIIISY